MHSYREGESLAEAIARIDAANYNAIDLNEFVFLPVDHAYRPDLEQRMRYYYFFEPHPDRLMRAWKPASGLNMLDSGGHILSGADIRIAPEQFALRHYIFRDQKHASRSTPTGYSLRETGERMAWQPDRQHPVHKFRAPVALDAASGLLTRGLVVSTARDQWPPTIGSQAGIGWRSQSVAYAISS